LDSQDIDEDNIWDILQWGKDPSITEEQVKNAYVENLKIALDSVEQLLETIEGRTIITADHGNLIGDRLYPIPVRGYGHRSGLRSPELVKVPWHIIESENRRVITEEPPQESVDRDENEVKEQLGALGYAD